MNPTPRRIASFVVLLGLAVCSSLRAQLLLTYGGLELDPTVEGSYVRWSNAAVNQELGRVGYQYVPQISVGQQWEYDHGVDAHGYDLYRGFVVFDLPRFTGILPRDEVVIKDPNNLYPHVTQFLARVTEFVFTRTGPSELPGNEPLPIEFRWSTFLADSFANGSINPTTAYNSLATGHLFNPNDDSIRQPMIDYLNHSNGGPIIFSFTVPKVIDQHTFSNVTTLDPHMTLQIEYGIYRAFSPVPEPSTFALAGLSVCLAAAAVRARRLRAPQCD